MHSYHEPEDSHTCPTCGDGYCDAHGDDEGALFVEEDLYGDDEEGMYDDPFDVVMYDMDVEADDLYGLIEMLTDAAHSWYAKRRLNALAASGPLSALVSAIIIDSLGRQWNPLLHPRDRFGRFINTGGFLRWLGGEGGDWLRGRVERIDSKGNIHVRSLGNDRVPDGTVFKFKPELAGKLVSTEEPVADLSLPDIDLDADIPHYLEASPTQKRIFNSLRQGDMPSEDLDVLRAPDDPDMPPADFANEIADLEERGLIEIDRTDGPDGPEQIVRRVGGVDDPNAEVVAVLDENIADVPDDETPDLEDSPELTKVQRDLLDRIAALDNGEGNGVNLTEFEGEDLHDDLRMLIDEGLLDEDADANLYLKNPEGEGEADVDVPESEGDITNEIFEAAKVIDDEAGQEAFQHFAEELARPGDENNAPLPEDVAAPIRRNAEAQANKWWEERNAGTGEEVAPEADDIPEEVAPEANPRDALNPRNQALADTLMGEEFPGEEFAEFLESDDGVKYAAAVKRLFDAEDYDEAGFPDQAEAERFKFEREMRQLGFDVPDEDIAGWPQAVQDMRAADGEVSIVEGDDTSGVDEAILDEREEQDFLDNEPVAEDGLLPEEREFARQVAARDDRVDAEADRIERGRGLLPEEVEFDRQVEARQDILDANEDRIDAGRADEDMGPRPPSALDDVPLPGEEIVEPDEQPEPDIDVPQSEVVQEPSWEDYYRAIDANGPADDFFERLNQENLAADQLELDLLGEDAPWSWERISEDIGFRPAELMFNDLGGNLDDAPGADPAPYIEQYENELLDKFQNRSEEGFGPEVLRLRQAGLIESTDGGNDWRLTQAGRDRLGLGDEAGPVGDVDPELERRRTEAEEDEFINQQLIGQPAEEESPGPRDSDFPDTEARNAMFEREIDDQAELERLRAEDRDIAMGEAEEAAPAEIPDDVNTDMEPQDVEQILAEEEAIANEPESDAGLGEPLEGLDVEQFWDADQMQAAVEILDAMKAAQNGGISRDEAYEVAAGHVRSGRLNQADLDNIQEAARQDLGDDWDPDLAIDHVGDDQGVVPEGERLADLVAPARVPGDGDAVPIADKPSHEKIINQPTFFENKPDLSQEGAVLDRNGRPVVLGAWYKANRGGEGDPDQVVGYLDQAKYPGLVLVQTPDGKMKIVDAQGKGPLAGLNRVADPGTEVRERLRVQRAVGGEDILDLDQNNPKNVLWAPRGEQGQMAEIGMRVGGRGDRGQFRDGDQGVIVRIGWHAPGNRPNIYVMKPGEKKELALAPRALVPILEGTPTPPSPPPAPPGGLDRNILPEREWPVPTDDELVARLNELGGAADLVRFVNAHQNPGVVFNQIQDLEARGVLEHVAAGANDDDRPQIRVPGGAAAAPRPALPRAEWQELDDEEYLRRIAEQGGEVRLIDFAAAHRNPAPAIGQGRRLLDEGRLERVEQPDGRFNVRIPGGGGVPEARAPLPDGAQDEFEGRILSILDADGGAGLKTADLVDMDAADAKDMLDALRVLGDRGILTSERDPVDSKLVWRRATQPDPEPTGPSLPNGARDQVEADILNAIDAAGTDGVVNSDLIDIDATDAPARLQALRALTSRRVIERIDNGPNQRPNYRRSEGGGDPAPMDRDQASGALQAGVDPHMVVAPNMRLAMQDAGFVVKDNKSSGNARNNFWAVSPEAGPFPVKLKGYTPDDGRVYMIKESSGDIKDDVIHELMSGVLHEDLVEQGLGDSPGLLNHPKVSLSKPPGTRMGHGAGGAIIMDHAAYGFPEKRELFSGLDKTSSALQDGNASGDIIKLALYDYIINNKKDRHRNNQMFAQDPNTGEYKVVVIDNGFGFGAGGSESLSFDKYVMSSRPSDLLMRADRRERERVEQAAREFVETYQNINVDSIVAKIRARFPTMTGEQESYIRNWLNIAKSRADSIAIDIDRIVDIIMGV